MNSVIKDKYSKEYIEEAQAAAKIILIMSIAIKNGLNKNDLKKLIDSTANEYKVDEKFSNACFLGCSKLFDHTNPFEFGKVIVKNEMLNIREPQMLSKWILGGKEC